MKPLTLLLVTLCIVTNIVYAQTYTYKDIDHLLLKAEKDSIAQIERLAALEFHRLINGYRQENNLTPIEWNETIWVATVNHNSWMSNANELSHSQEENTTYFTGTRPGSRLHYAAGGNTSMSWSGENALYNYSSSGSTKKEIAKNIARKSFIQWKNSPGHNKNMLGKSHRSHGVAFKITKDKVWGTDLFSRSVQQQVNPSPMLVNKAAVPVPKKRVRFNSSKNKRLVQEKVMMQLTDDLHLKSKNTTHKNSTALRKAYSHLGKRYKTVAANGVLLTHNKHTTEKRFLGLFNRKKHIYTAVLEKPITDFNGKAVSEQLVNLLKHNQNLNTKSKIDVAVALKKRKDKVRICMVSILQNPNRKIHVF